MRGVIELGTQAVLQALQFFALRGDDEVHERAAFGVRVKRECIAEGVIGAEDDEVKGEERDGSGLWKCR